MLPVVPATVTTLWLLCFSKTKDPVVTLFQYHLFPQSPIYSMMSAKVKHQQKYMHTVMYELKLAFWSAYLHEDRLTTYEAALKHITT